MVDNLIELLKKQSKELDDFREKNGGLDMENEMHTNFPHGTMLGLDDIQKLQDECIDWLEDPNTYDPG